MIFFPLPLWCDYLPFSLLICGQDNVCVCLPDTVKIFISIWQREMFYFWQNTIQWLLINEEQQPLNMIIYCLTRKETRENKIQTGSYSKVWLFLFSNQIHLHSRKHTIVVALEKLFPIVYIYIPLCTLSITPALTFSFGPLTIPYNHCIFLTYYFYLLSHLWIVVIFFSH